MNRRFFLQTSAATLAGSLCGPLLSRARAGKALPRRFVFLVEGNGIDPIALMTPDTEDAIAAHTSVSLAGRRSFAEYYGHDSTLLTTDALSTARSLGPLAKHGLEARSQVVLGLSSTITGGGHATSFGALSSTRSSSATPGGPTIDSVLSEIAAVRGTTPFSALRVGIDDQPDPLRTNLCAAAAGSALPMVMDAETAFYSVFGSVAGATGQEAFARRNRLLEHARDETSRALAELPGGTQARAQLEAYLTSIETLITRQAVLADMTDVLSAVKPPEPQDNALLGGTPLDALQAQCELVEAALVGGLTNVAVISAGAGGEFDLAYPELTELQRHDLHHAAPTDDRDDAYVGVIHAVTERHVDMLSAMAARLAAIPEGDGSMLDHTMLMLMSDNGEAHHSDGQEWPCLLIGGSSLGFHADGRTTVFPGVGDKNNRQLSNLFNTLGHAAGLDLDDFGAEGATRIAEGPLSELWTSPS